MAKTAASMVRELMLKPNKASMANVPIKQTGMVTKGISEALSVRRKMKITKATSTTASPMV